MNSKNYTEFWTFYKVDKTGKKERHKRDELKQRNNKMKGVQTKVAVHVPRNNHRHLRTCPSPMLAIQVFSQCVRSKFSHTLDPQADLVHLESPLSKNISHQRERRVNLQRSQFHKHLSLN